MHISTHEKKPNKIKSAQLNWKVNFTKTSKRDTPYLSKRLKIGSEYVNVDELRTS